MHQKRSNGFTLIETLVAVMILATAVAGPLSIASRSLTNSLVTKEQIIAFALAQDAVEYVRYARDTNVLSGGNWIAGPGGANLTPCTSANGCEVDTTSNVPNATPTACSSATCDTLYYDAANGRYTYNTSGTVKTQFARQIVLTSISATEYKLVVSVTWTDVGNKSRSVQIYEYLYNWQ